MSSTLDEFDLNAAILRNSQKDMRAFMAALAARLEGALPGRVKIDRRRDGLFSASSHVARITVEDAENALVLAFEGARLTAARTKIVRGVSIGTSAMTVPQWLAELKAAIARMAEAGAEAGDVLHGFL